MEFFEIFSKSLHQFSQILYMVIDINSAHLLAKTACPAKIWFSRYRVKRGSDGGQNGVFRLYVKKSSLVFLDILHGNRHQQCASFSENRMSGKNLVLKIWGQTGVKMDFFDKILKSVHLFSQIFYMIIEVNNALFLVKTASPAKIWSSRYGEKRGDFFEKKIPICFFDFIISCFSFQVSSVMCSCKHHIFPIFLILS